MTNGKLRLAFAGTPELARSVLQAIIDADQHCVQKVFTQPDRPAGRGRKLKQSEVKQLALEHAIPVLQPATKQELKPEMLSACDIMLVVAYGLIITPDILAKPPLGCINIHTSLLPRWRGAAPIQRAIEAGDTETGITIMQMDSGLDTGPIIEQISCPILEQDTAGNLHDRLAHISAESINRILTKIARQEIQKKMQDDAHTCYADKITKQEALLDWTRPAVELERKIRAFNPFPVAHATLKDKTMRIFAASVKDNVDHALKAGEILNNNDTIDIVTGDGILSITRLQLPGKKIISAKDFLNGHPDFAN